MAAERARTWVPRTLILGLTALATTACSIEWDAPDGDVSEWVTSNR